MTIDKILQSFTVGKLRALKTIVESSTPTIESGKIGEVLKISNLSLGGRISSLTRTKINNLPLVRVIAKTENRQTLLKYNDKIGISKTQMKNMIDNILKELSE